MEHSLQTHHISICMSERKFSSKTLQFYRELYCLATDLAIYYVLYFPEQILITFAVEICVTDFRYF